MNETPQAGFGAESPQIVEKQVAEQAAKEAADKANAKPAKESK